METNSTIGDQSRPKRWFRLKLLPKAVRQKNDVGLRECHGKIASALELEACPAGQQLTVRRENFEGGDAGTESVRAVAGWEIHST